MFPFAHLIFILNHNPKTSLYEKKCSRSFEKADNKEQLLLGLTDREIFKDARKRRQQLHFGTLGKV